MLPRIILFGFCVITISTGCGRKTGETPIPRDKLPAILLDVYLAETEAAVLENSVLDARVAALQKHGYDTTDLKESIRILTENPEIGKEVYQALLDSAIFEQREIRSRMMADSVEAAED